MDLLTWLVGAFLSSLLVGGAGLALSPGSAPLPGNPASKPAAPATITVDRGPS